MTNKNNFLEKLVYDEIKYKNNAINAYDGIIWKIRAGFLTLLFSGWAILLKGVLEETGGFLKPHITITCILFGFISIGFSLAAWYVDRNYVRRKFRVINALNQLTDEIRTIDNDYLKITPDLLKISGDNGSDSYKIKGYKEANKAVFCIYAMPIIFISIIISLIFYVI